MADRAQQNLSRKRWLAAFASVAAAATLGCGSDSTDAFAEFEGTWRVDFSPTANPASIADISCPATLGAGTLDLWDKVTLQRGTLSDLIDTAGPSALPASANCQFAFDVDSSGKIANALAADPYTGLPSQCLVLFDFASGTDPATGDAHSIVWTMTPNTNSAAMDRWRFQLLNPVKGAPPPGQLVGTGQGMLEDRDTTARTTSTIDNCSYNVQLTLIKIAK